MRSRFEKTFLCAGVSLAFALVGAGCTTQSRTVEVPVVSAVAEARNTASSTSIAHLQPGTPIDLDAVTQAIATQTAYGRTRDVSRQHLSYAASGQTPPSTRATQRQARNASAAPTIRNSRPPASAAPDNPPPKTEEEKVVSVDEVGSRPRRF